MRVPALRAGILKASGLPIRFGVGSGASNTALRQIQIKRVDFVGAQIAAQEAGAIGSQAAPGKGRRTRVPEQPFQVDHKFRVSLANLEPPIARMVGKRTVECEMVCPIIAANLTQVKQRTSMNALRFRQARPAIELRRTLTQPAVTQPALGSGMRDCSPRWGQAHFWDTPTETLTDGGIGVHSRYGFRFGVNRGRHAARSEDRGFRRLAVRAATMHLHRQIPPGQTICL